MRKRSGFCNMVLFAILFWRSFTGTGGNGAAVSVDVAEGVSLGGGMFGVEGPNKNRESITERRGM